MATVRSISIEHTPSADIFGDQSGLGGVDCDVLVEATGHDDAAVVVSIETKFVEPEFSTCSFRDRKRIKAGKPYCQDDVRVRADHGACLYASLKRYAYCIRCTDHVVAVLIAEPQPWGPCRMRLSGRGG